MLIKRKTFGYKLSFRIGIYDTIEATKIRVKIYFQIRLAFLPRNFFPPVNGTYRRFSNFISSFHVQACETTKTTRMTTTTTIGRMERKRKREPENGETGFVDRTIESRPPPQRMGIWIEVRTPTSKFSARIRGFVTVGIRSVHTRSDPASISSEGVCAFFPSRRNPLPFLLRRRGRKRTGRGRWRKARIRKNGHREIKLRQRTALDRRLDVLARVHAVAPPWSQRTSKEAR